VFLLGWSVFVTVVASGLVALRGGRVGTDSEMGLLLVLSFVGAVPALLSNMLAQILRNEFKAVLYAVSTVVVAALAFGLGMAVGIGMGLGAVGVALGVVIGQVVGALMRLWLVRDSVTGRLDRHVLPPLLRFGVPLVPASLAMWVFTGADRIALGLFGGASDVGAYSVAAAIVGPFAVVVAALGQAWIPRITALDSEDRQKARDTTASAVFLALSGLGLAALALGAAAPWAVTVVGGADYSSGADALPALALGAAFAGTALFSSTGLILAKKTLTVTLVTAVAAVLDLGLLVLLVPLHGPLGAALSVCLANMVLAGGLLYRANRDYAIRVDPLRGAVVVGVLAAQTAISTVLPGTVWVALGVALSSFVVIAVNWPSLKATVVKEH
jgi:O-antigen/teichoic acid export membrane protein